MDVHIPTNDGYWVSEGFCRLQEVIQDFNRSRNCDLELRWIPPNARTEQNERSNPYCLFDRRSNAPVFFASELDTPEDILTKLLDIDNTNGDVLRKLEARNTAIEIINTKKRLEQLEEASDMAEFMLRSPINYLKHKTSDGTIVKLDDQRRRVK